MTQPRFSADRIRTVAVVGAGTMGHGIAHVAALAGCTVALTDALPGAAEKALAKVKGNLDKGVELGKLPAETRDLAMSRLRAARDLEDAAAGVDCVVEAIPEKLEWKTDLFGKLDRLAPDALLATNTSSLPIAKIAAAVRDPSRVIGMHFFNPVHLMKLCEVVRHDQTDATAVDAAKELAERWGKTAIVVEDSPGFASSRLGLVLGLEAIRMVEAGVASAADIDTAMKLGYAHPMGPLELTDLVGLDVRLGIAEYLATELGAAFTPPALLRQMVKDGKLGKKSGEGFYRWVDGKRA